ncbi:UNVERIFIED_CONTAM: hypothetical protein Sindi_1409700 [Sesamum indicum]
MQKLRLQRENSMPVHLLDKMMKEVQAAKEGKCSSFQVSSGPNSTEDACSTKKTGEIITEKEDPPKAPVTAEKNQA